MLAGQVARLFLIARNEEALKAVQAEIRARGGETPYVVADVADHSPLLEAAKAVLGA